MKWLVFFHIGVIRGVHLRAGRQPGRWPLPKIALCPLLLFLLLTGCRPDERAAADGLIDDLPTVALQCESLSADPSRPRFATYAVLAESKVKLAEMATCGPIDPSEYQQLNIPADALTAVGGWWAGLGEYLYVRQEGPQTVFYLGQLDEESEAPRPDYVPVATYAGRQFQILRPLNQADLAGIYTYQSADTAYVLFLGMRADTMEATLFYQPGALPPPNEIHQSLPDFSVRPLPGFIFYLSNLSFDSDLGPGVISWTPDSSQLVFSRLLTTQGKPITFQQVR